MMREIPTLQNSKLCHLSQNQYKIVGPSLTSNKIHLTSSLDPNKDVDSVNYWPCFALDL